MISDLAPTFGFVFGGLVPLLLLLCIWMFILLFLAGHIWTYLMFLLRGGPMPRAPAGSLGDGGPAAGDAAGLVTF